MERGGPERERLMSVWARSDKAFSEVSEERTCVCMCISCLFVCFCVAVYIMYDLVCAHMYVSVKESEVFFLSLK